MIVVLSKQVYGVKRHVKVSSESHTTFDKRFSHKLTVAFEQKLSHSMVISTVYIRFNINDLNGFREEIVETENRSCKVSLTVIGN